MGLQDLRSCARLRCLGKPFSNSHIPLKVDIVHLAPPNHCIFSVARGTREEEPETLTGLCTPCVAPFEL